MSYINIYIKGSQEPIKKYITNEVYPFVIFHEHLKNIHGISMYKNDEQTSDYIVTLYTKKYLIHLDRVTNIDSVPAADEQIHVNESTLLNLHTVDFYKGTVTLRQNVEDSLINKIIPLQSNTVDNDEEPLSLDTSNNVKPYYDGTYDNCSEMLTKCEQNNTNEKQYLEDAENYYKKKILECESNSLKLLYNCEKAKTDKIEFYEQNIKDIERQFMDAVEQYKKAINIYENLIEACKIQN